MHFAGMIMAILHDANLHNNEVTTPLIDRQAEVKRLNRQVIKFKPGSTVARTRISDTSR